MNVNLNNFSIFISDLKTVMSTTEVEYTYKSYTIPGPNKLPQYIYNLLVIVNNRKLPNAERSAARNELYEKLREIGRKIRPRIFDNTWNMYICATRHLYTAFFHKKGQMYFCDVQLHDVNEPSEPTDENVWEPDIRIVDVHVWKMTTGLISTVYLEYVLSRTVGLRPYTDIKPVFGINGRKLEITPHSYFLEGSHQEIYEYPYHFFHSEDPYVDGIPNENWYENGTTNI